MTQSLLLCLLIITRAKFAFELGSLGIFPAECTVYVNWKHVKLYAKAVFRVNKAIIRAGLDKRQQL